MSGLGPIPDDAASARSYTQNLRRIFRREPDMGDDPVDYALATGVCLFLTVPVVIFGAAEVWLGLTVSTSLPMIMAIGAIMIHHIHGPRHRWWALGIAGVVSFASGRTVNAVLNDDIGSDWALIAGYLCAGWIGAHVYAAVTHLPHRRST